MMLPQPLNNSSERGYYIFFDPKSWTRERVNVQSLFVFVRLLAELMRLL
jgi:hypothetical protein